MNNMACDFSGYVTKANLKCSDGRIIDPGAFSHLDGKTVPLIWDHQHNDPTCILGKVVLEHRDDGMYGYGFFNDTEMGQDMKKVTQHGDITSMSIFANHLKQNGAVVKHGEIREVSLCLAGANPDAWIDYVAHSDIPDEHNCAYIYIDEGSCEFHHSDMGETDDVEEQDESVEEEIQNEDDTQLEHSETGKEPTPMADKNEKTIGDVVDTMTEEQKAAVEFLIDQAVSAALEANEEDNMKHNAFAKDQETDSLMHSEEAMNAIIGDAKRCGSLKESFLAHSAEYGIEQIDWLQPEFQSVTGNEPMLIKRNPDAWVDIVTNGVHHTPFSKVKMMFADLRADEARAKGYAKKGKYKVEEVISLLKKQVSATTVYKKQKLDRDDVIEITDMSVVAWLKSEMRMMLNEELARAYIFGDGRTALDDDKIDESCIKPVWKHEDLFCIKATVTPEEGQELGDAIIDASVTVQDNYEGSGNITLFMDAKQVTKCLLLKDKDGHRFYKDINELATAMNVNKIAKVPSSVMPAGVIAIGLDLSDYNVGADKGGAINMFDDFDIDYNQMKYLIETRCSGTLTKPFSAFVLKSA